MAKSRKDVTKDYYDKRKKEGIVQIRFDAPLEFKERLRKFQKKKGFINLYETTKYLLQRGERL